MTSVTELREEELQRHSARLMFRQGQPSDTPENERQRERFEQRERARAVLTARRARLGLDDHGTPIDE